MYSLKVVVFISIQSVVHVQKLYQNTHNRNSQAAIGGWEIVTDGDAGKLLSFAKIVAIVCVIIIILAAQKSWGCLCAYL